MTKREDYRGWSVNIPLTQYRVEYVSYKHLPVTLAIHQSLSRHTVKRFELEGLWMRFTK